MTLVQERDFSKSVQTHLSENFLTLSHCSFALKETELPRYPCEGCPVMERFMLQSVCDDILSRFRDKTHSGICIQKTVTVFEHTFC